MKAKIKVNKKGEGYVIYHKKGWYLSINPLVVYLTSKPYFRDEKHFEVGRHNRKRSIEYFSLAALDLSSDYVRHQYLREEK